MTGSINRQSAATRTLRELLGWEIVRWNLTEFTENVLKFRSYPESTIKPTRIGPGERYFDTGFRKYS